MEENEFLKHFRTTCDLIKDLKELMEDNKGTKIVLHATINIQRLHVPRGIEYIQLTNINLYVPKSNCINVIACLPSKSDYRVLLESPSKPIVYIY